MEALGGILALKRLHEDDAAMAFWPTFNRVLLLVAKTLVEPGGLKGVRCEDDLRATATNGLRFGRVEE